MSAVPKSSIPGTLPQVRVGHCIRPLPKASPYAVRIWEFCLRLGSGAFGIVWRCYRTELRKEAELLIFLTRHAVEVCLGSVVFGCWCVGSSLANFARPSRALALDLVADCKSRLALDA